MINPAGVYVWMLSGKDQNGTNISEKGSVVLIR